MKSIIIMLLIILTIYIIAFFIYKKTKKIYPMIIISFIGLICTITLTIIYSHDVFYLPNNSDSDGIPVTSIMRLLSGNETFNTTYQKISGIIYGILFITIHAVIFIISCIKQRKHNN